MADEQIMPDMESLPAPDDDEREPEAAGDFAGELMALAVETANRRGPLESRWWADYLQHEGHDIGDYNERFRPALDQIFGDRDSEEQKGSTLVANVTRPLTRIMEARLVDTLQPRDESNWDIRATPVPEIEAAAQINREELGDDEDLQAQRDTVDQSKREADLRVMSMKELMKDQLKETDYDQICRDVIHNACKYGTGVLKGPVKNLKKKRRWSKDGKLTWLDDDRPYYRLVDIFDFYPDMDADSVEDCDFIFELHRMPARELRKVGNQGIGFRKDAVRMLLEEEPAEMEFIDTVRDVRRIDYADEGQGENRRYYVWEYHGPIPTKTFDQLCKQDGDMEMLDVFGRNADDPLDVIQGVVWFCQGHILKYGPAPSETGDQLYSVFHIEDDTRSLFKKGIPAIVRDPQKAVTAAWRSMLDNAYLAGGPMFEIDNGMQPADGKKEIRPFKIWLRNASLGDQQGILPVEVSGNTQNLVEVLSLARAFANAESSLPEIVQGEPSSEGGQLGRTAQGMSLVASAVNVLFRNGTRNFDQQVTRPTLRRLYDWNMQFAEDPEIKGDMEIVPRGSEVLLVRDVMSQHLMMILNLMATVPSMTEIVKMPPLIRELFRTLQLPEDELLNSDEEIAEAAQAAAEQPDPQMALEEMKMQGQMQIEEMRLQVQAAKIASDENTTLQQVMAQLEGVKLKTGSDERTKAAEFALKQQFGTGI